MADRVHIALREGRAINRLQEVMARVSAGLDVEPVEMPNRRKAGNMLTALQLEAFVQWAEDIADAVLPLDSPEGVEYVQSEYEKLTKKELRAQAAERGIDLTGLNLKSELIDALMAADGVTEEEQAAADGVTMTDGESEQPPSEDDVDDDFGFPVEYDPDQLDDDGENAI